mgnify:CR=1 FL=1
MKIRVLIMQNLSTNELTVELSNMFEDVGSKSVRLNKDKQTWSPLICISSTEVEVSLLPVHATNKAGDILVETKDGIKPIRIYKLSNEFLGLKY